MRRSRRKEFMVDAQSNIASDDIIYFSIQIIDSKGNRIAGSDSLDISMLKGEQEVVDSELFGQQRVTEAVTAFEGTPQELIESTTDAVHQFVGDHEQSDDLTMLVFRLAISLLLAIMVGTTTVGAATDVCPQLLSDSVAQTAAPGDTVIQKESIWKRVSDKLGARYFNSKYDSAYVVRPEGKGLTLKVRMNQTGNTFHAKGTVDGVFSKSDLSTSHKTTFSLAATYRGIGAAIAINPAKWSGVYKDYEFNLNYYGSRLSLDLSYQRSESLSGDFHGDRGDKRLESGEANLKVLNLVGYYTFNHRRFSYPAAFNQSYIQRRSAGSWLLGISYQGGSIKTNDELTQRAPDAPVTTIEFGHIGIGGGYGYNLVLGRKWLLHASVLPTVVVYNRNKMIVNGEEKEAQHIHFNMIFNERLAVVYNFSPRFFAGATLVMNNSVFDDKNVTFNQNKWRARAFLGMRF